MFDYIKINDVVIRKDFFDSYSISFGDYTIIMTFCDNKILILIQEHKEDKHYVDFIYVDGKIEEISTNYELDSLKANKDSFKIKFKDVYLEIRVVDFEDNEYLVLLESDSVKINMDSFK